MVPGRLGNCSPAQKFKGEIHKKSKRQCFSSECEASSYPVIRSKRILIIFCFKVFSIALKFCFMISAYLDYILKYTSSKFWEHFFITDDVISDERWTETWEK